MELDLYLRARDLAQRQAMNRAATDGHLDCDTSPVQPVGALAVDLHRRGRRDAQLDLAGEGSQGRLEIVWHLRPLDHVSVGVTRGRADAEPDLGDVSLVEADQVAREPGRAAEQDEQ